MFCAQYDVYNLRNSRDALIHSAWNTSGICSSNKCHRLSALEYHTANAAEMKIPDFVDLSESKIIGIFQTETEYIVICQDRDDNWSLNFQKLLQLPVEFDRHLFNIPSYLERDVHVIISTGSGTCLAPLYFEQVIKPLLEVIRVGYKPFYTTSRNSVKEFAKKITGTVILLSGDGGISDLINYSNSHLTIVLFPLGTGNAIFNSYLKSGLESLLHGQTRPLPNFQATFHQAKLNGEPIDLMLGAVVASYGFHATLVDESEKYRELGDGRFKKIAAELLENPRKYIGTVNGEEMKGYAAVTMVKKLDKDFTISPENELRLIHTDTSDIMKGYAEGLGAWKVDKVEFNAEGRMCIDGLIIDIHGRVVIEEVESRVDIVI